MDLLLDCLRSGLASLVAYLAAHVLLCLVPAFFIAGALSALVPQGAIVRWLGPGAPKWAAYPAAASAGSLLAVCSCTIQPLFAGIYGKGAGLGPAITFLFFAPAANILALSYTGVALGAEFALARVLLSLSFGIGIGLIMASLFRRDDDARVADAASFTDGATIGRPALLFLAALVALLLAGTLKIDLLATRFAGFEIALPGSLAAQQWLDRLLPVDALRGDEGLSLHGASLIVLLALLAALGRRGLGRVEDGIDRWTLAALTLAALTLVFAALGLRASPAGLEVTVSGRTLAVAAVLLLLPALARRLDPWDRQQWLWETWRFVRQIFPLLVVGVFLVGVVRVFIRPEWVQQIAGANTVAGNLAGVVFGVFMYFPTLVEVPVAKMFLALGMHPGPLIAYLMADPELSLQSILITAAIIGRLKAWTYVGLVALFSTAAGLAYGAWIDGTPAATLVLAIAAGVGLLVAAVHRLGQRPALPTHH